MSFLGPETDVPPGSACRKTTYKTCELFADRDCANPGGSCLSKSRAIRPIPGHAAAHDAGDLG